MPASANTLLSFLNGFLGTNTCGVNWNSLLCLWNFIGATGKTNIFGKQDCSILYFFVLKGILLKNNKNNSEGEGIKKTILGKGVPSRVPDGLSEVCPRLRLGAAEKVWCFLTLSLRTDPGDRQWWLPPAILLTFAEVMSDFLHFLLWTLLKEKMWIKAKTCDGFSHCMLTLLSRWMSSAASVQGSCVGCPTNSVWVCFSGQTSSGTWTCCGLAWAATPCSWRSTRFSSRKKWRRCLKGYWLPARRRRMARSAL